MGKRSVDSISAARPGRNEPCPCGSGKKYKQCCLIKQIDAAHSEHELAWRRVRRALEGFPAKMLSFIGETYGGVAFTEAWEEFFQGEPPPVDMDSPHFAIFNTWFYFRWTPDFPASRVADKTLTDIAPALALLQRNPKRVGPVLQNYLSSALLAPLSFYEVLTVSPGKGLRLREFFTQREVDVIERSASESLRGGELIFACLVECEGVVVIDGMGGFALPPAVKQTLIDFGEEFRITSRTALERLAEYDLELIALYLDAAETLVNPRLPEVNNTDGEAVEPQALIYDIDSAEDSFNALADLNFQESAAQQREMATLTPSGSIKKVEIAWLDRGNKMHPSWSSTVLGRLLIDGKRLRAEVNSDNRAERIRKIIDTRLGAAARYRFTERQSLQKMLNEARADDSVTSEGESDLMQLPEVQERMREMLVGHYETWPDIALPALKGKTPREACKTKRGRERVAALVDEIEYNSARQPGFDPGIIDRLRKDLGLMGSGDCL